MTTTTTPQGVANVTDELSGMDTATEAFLARFSDEAGEQDAPKKKPSEKNESKGKPAEDEQPETDETDETSDESPEDKSTEDDEGADDEQSSKKYVDDDETYVKIKVGDQELEVPVKDLKRLHGQEASLTRKSQELAEQRKTVEADAHRYAAGLDAMVKRAEAKANEFRKINFLALTKDPNVNAEQLSILQDEARKAFEEEQFLKTELGTFVQASQQYAQVQIAETAKQTVKTLSDPDSPHYIDGWNKQVWNDLRDFAVGEGLDKDIVNNLVDAPAIKLLHMAMMYKAGSKKVVTQKVNKSPKKIVKTSQTPVSNSLKSSKSKDAMKTLRQKGTVDAATDAFLARFEDAD